MAQVFSAAGVLAIKLGLLGACAIAVAAPVAWYHYAEGPYARLAAPPQPIPFSHAHHVGDDGIDCRYCHASVETAAFAGMPTSEVCMTCHSQLFTDAPLLEPLRRSVASGEPLRWTRVHDLPGFAYFSHGVHVSHGLECGECHGRIDAMPLTRRVASLEMQWCLECHRARATDPAMRRKLTDCSTCHR
jgi:hypothetical protein